MFGGEEVSLHFLDFYMFLDQNNLDVGREIERKNQKRP